MGNLGDTVSLFVFLKYGRSMAEINFRFPCVLRRWVPFPYSQVQSSARRALVGYYMVDFVFFFGVNPVKRRLREEGTMCFGLTIRR